MRILLDSHTLLWWIDDPGKLAPSARLVIADPSTEVFASAASVWELGLKVSKGKLKLPAGFEEELGLNGIASLSFTIRHAAESIKLPPIHGDPFDRALIAQCRLENLTLATRDSILAQYGIPILEV